MANNTLIYSRPENVTSVPGFFFEYPATLLPGNLWGDMILLTVFSISYLSLSVFPAKRAFAASSFITLVTAILMMSLPPTPIIGSFEFSVVAIITVLSLMINWGDSSTL